MTKNDKNNKKTRKKKGQKNDKQNDKKTTNKMTNKIETTKKWQKKINKMTTKIETTKKWQKNDKRMTKYIFYIFQSLAAQDPSNFARLDLEKNWIERIYFQKSILLSLHFPLWCWNLRACGRCVSTRIQCAHVQVLLRVHFLRAWVSFRAWSWKNSELKGISS